MILGIDLGTTKSVVGVWQGKEPYIISDKAGHTAIPSLVLVTPGGEIVAGRLAREHPDRYKGKNITISSVKRLMGKKGETGWGWWKTYPQEVSAFILAELKNQAERYLGQEVKQAVIAIPSHFDESQRRATKEAAEIAGLEVLRLLNEATAAVLAYGFHKQDEGNVLVFDLGGGTLDISIVELGEGVYEVKCIEGDSKLGGDDFDQIIVDYILKKLREEYGTDVELSPLQKMMLKEASETAKIELSSRLNSLIHIPGFLHVGGKYHDLNVSIDRKTFEQLSSSLFDRAIVLLKKALHSAYVFPSDFVPGRSSHTPMSSKDLNALLLLGGSSRIPRIRERIKEELDIEPFTGVAPEICVAQGAIIHAAVLGGMVSDILLLDVIPSSYGTELKDDKFSKMISKNTTVPTKKSQIFTTTEDNQPTVPIRIYQGENEEASENSFLGTIELGNIPPAKAGTPKIEITFDVDPNMIVHVSGKDLGTGKEQDVVVKSPYGLNNVQISSMQQKLKTWLSERQVLEIKPQANSVISSIKEMVSRKGTLLEQQEVSRLRESVASLEELVKKRAVYEELENGISATRSIYNKVQQKVAHYEKVTKEINKLVAKIDGFVPMLKVLDQKQSILLSQGRDLLRDCIQRNLSCDELQRMFLGIRSEYEKTKTDLIKTALRDLETFPKMEELIVQLGNKLSDPSLINESLSNIRKIKNIDSIVSLLQLEDYDYRQSIQQRVLEETKGNANSLGYFILILVAFIDFQIISDIDEKLLHDERIGNFLTPVLFGSLHFAKPAVQRKKVAQAIAEYPYNIVYLGTVVNSITRESDSTVKRYLLDYVEKCPRGTFCEFFMNAEYNTKTKIARDKQMLEILSREPTEESCLLGLELLSKLPDKEAIPVLISLADNLNLNVRTKTLRLITRFKDKDTQIAKVFVEALRDPSPEIRMLGLEFVEHSENPSYLAHVFALLQSEKSENVKEKAITLLRGLKDRETIHYFLKLLMDDSHKIRNIALSSLEDNIEFMRTDVKKLFNVVRKVVQKRSSLGIKNLFFLSRFSRKHPEMGDVVQALRKIAKK